MHDEEPAQGRAAVLADHVDPWITATQEQTRLGRRNGVAAMLGWVLLVMLALGEGYLALRTKPSSADSPIIYWGKRSFRWSAFIAVPVVIAIGVIGAGAAIIDMVR